MKSIIIEDNESNFEALALLLAQNCPEVEIIGKATTIKDALVMIGQLKPELIFLDIELPDGYSFEILERLSEINFSIIFVTGISDQILRAFEFSAVDYLLKPVNGDKLKMAVDRAKNQIFLRKSGEQFTMLMEMIRRQNNPRPRITLSDQKVIIFPYLDEIMLVEAQGANTNFYLETRPEPMSISKNIKEFEKLFEPYPMLMRTHRSYIINIQKVQTFQKETNIAVLHSGLKCPIAASAKEEFLQRFGAI